MAKLPSARELFTRATLRRSAYGDRHADMDRLYRFQDPWNMASDGERLRFEETNAIVSENFPGVATLLEVGCGEGHQSVVLAELAETLIGIDVSERAVARARERCPSGRFEAATFDESTLVAESQPFDLIVAAEVLYYMSDPASFLSKMGHAGRGCLVTYYGAHADRLDPLVQRQPLLGMRDIQHGDARWRAAWWRPPAHD